MGNRTLSLQLVLRALFFDRDAFDDLRDDDNPFMEGAFLLVIIGTLSALLNLVGQLLAWASGPSLEAIRAVVLDVITRMPWWALIRDNTAARDQFMQMWDAGWRIFPLLFGAPDPVRAGLNIVAWPVIALLSWLVYGLLAHVSARLLGGQGSLNRLLGTTALAATPLLLRGLGVIPFLTVGAVVNTWQLLLRFRAVRSTHGLSVGRAAWATIIPYFIYLLIWMVVLAVAVTILRLAGGR